MCKKYSVSGEVGTKNNVLTKLFRNSSFHLLETLSFSIDSLIPNIFLVFENFSRFTTVGDQIYVMD